MVLSDWQVAEVAAYVRRGCDERGPVYGDMLDHLCCLVEERMDDGLDFGDALREASQRLPGDEMKQTEQETLTMTIMDKPCTPRMALLAMLPWTLMYLGFYLGVDNTIGPRWFQRGFMVLLQLIPMLVIVAYGFIGWKRNFPRWTFPVIILALWSLYWVIYWEYVDLFVQPPGYRGGEWVGVVIAGVMAIVAAILNPTLDPFRGIVRRVKDDPWLVLFAFYPFAGIFAFRFLDDVPVDGWRIAFAVGVAAVFSWGFYKFLTMEDKTRRVLVLLASLAVIFAGSWLYGYVA